MGNNEFKAVLGNIFKDDIKKIVLSNSVVNDSKYRRIDIEKKNNGNYLVTALTQKQSFNQNLNPTQIEEYVSSNQLSFKQYNFFSETKEYMIKISKKEKIFFSEKKLDAPIKHNDKFNREKNYIIKESSAIEPLIDMGIFTKEGKVVSSMYDKYRQINKYIEIIDESIKKMNLKSMNIIDFGCGKSYLTFVVYYYLKFIRNIDVQIIGLDLKENVIEECNKASEKYGYTGLRFEVGDINGFAVPFDVDMVMTLHACDIATDFALYNAIKWGAKMIFSVPCCQHELNAQIQSDDFSILTRYGIVKERLSALFTDAIRCNLLRCSSYNVDLLEFVNFENTPKNLLIRAVKTNVPTKIKKQCLNEVDTLLKEFNCSQKLRELLAQEDSKLF